MGFLLLELLDDLVDAQQLDLLLLVYFMLDRFESVGLFKDFESGP